MSLATAKPGTDTTNRELTSLPDVPRLASLSPSDQAHLDAWWRKVKEVLLRYEDATKESLNSLAG